MTEFCSISIVAFGILAIGLHLSALIQPYRQSRRRLPTRYLPPASRPLALRTEIKHSTPIESKRG